MHHYYYYIGTIAGWNKAGGEGSAEEPSCIVQHRTNPQTTAFGCVMEQSRGKRNTTDASARLFPFFFFHTQDCSYLYVSVRWTCTPDRSRVEWTVTNGCRRAESYCQGVKDIVIEVFTFNPSLTCWKSLYGRQTLWNVKNIYLHRSTQFLAHTNQ